MMKTFIPLLALISFSVARAGDNHMTLEKKFFGECKVRYQTAYVSELKEELVPLIDQAARSCLQSKYNSYYLSKLGEVGIPSAPETSYQMSTNSGFTQRTGQYDNAMAFLAHAMTAFQGQQQLDRINEETMQAGLEVLQYRLNQSINSFQSERSTLASSGAVVGKYWNEELKAQINKTREKNAELQTNLEKLRQQQANNPVRDPFRQSQGLLALNATQDLPRMQAMWPDHQIAPYALPISALAKERHAKKYISTSSNNFPAAAYQQGKVDLISNSRLRNELSQTLSSAHKFYSKAKQSPEAYKTAHELVNAVVASRYQANGMGQAPNQQQKDLMARVQQFEQQGVLFQTKEKMLHEEINNGIFHGVQEQVAREGLVIAKGLNAAAEEQFFKSDLTVGEELRDTAIQLLDIAMGVIPVISTAKDAYELFSGKNILTGIELTSTERVLAGVGVATVGFAGAAKLPKVISVIENIGKKIARPISNAILGESRRIIESAVKLGIKSPEGTKVYAKIYDAIETLPQGLSIKRIKEGVKSDKIAVIGRSMGDLERVGVLDVAKHFDGKKIKVETFEPGDSWDSFMKTVNEYRLSVGDPSAKLPNNLVVNTDMYLKNKAWAEKLSQEGYYVMDIGDPNGLNIFSPFYSMEKLVIFK